MSNAKRRFSRTVAMPSGHDGRQRRDFVHVLDVVAANLLAMERGEMEERLEQFYR